MLESMRKHMFQHSGIIRSAALHCKNKTKQKKNKNKKKNALSAQSVQALHRQKNTWHRARDRNYSISLKNYDHALIDWPLHSARVPTFMGKYTHKDEQFTDGSQH